jgi:acyl-CoA dehydrogenase
MEVIGMFALLMRWMKAQKILPSISETERQALEAGTVWIDGDFFRGKPDFARMLADPYSKLSAEEQAFLDGPVENLLNMIDRYAIARTKRIPDEVLDFLKQQGFMGLIIPKEYGGKDFSTLAVSTVMAKIGPVNSTVGTFVVIPNSLGAGELIIHYGTQAQKDHYLPKLASGEYLPCFGLTEPTAGSDAASIKADGLVFRDADGSVKLRLNFRKRYITLAPVANLCTIACKLRDPDNLLGKGDEPGITCVLVHDGTPGFTHGDHHDPIGDPFYNGPLYGKDVVVPVDNIIGGVAYAGLGWKMLMEQLAGGRAVSLPAGAVGGAKAVALATGAYSMVRQQFGIPVGRMEGVEEKVAYIAGLSYLMEAARVYGCSAVDAGHQPPVVSAILKACTTELQQKISIAGMDVMAGAAVMQGPNNILGKAYTSAPVGVTVEGANILTRTLMIFGQGATRCHPYALKVVEAVEKDDVPRFRENLLGWIGHFLKGVLRAEFHFLTRGRFVSVPDVASDTRRYYRRLGWAAARFGVLTDLAMFAIGGKLKARGKLTGRYADVLSWLVLGFSALRRFEAEGRRREDLPLVHYALNFALAQIQTAFEGIYQNFDGPLGLWMKTVGVFEARLNPIGSAPTDAQSHAAALCIQTDNAQYRRLGQDVFLPRDETRGFGRLLRAFHLVSEAHPAAEAIIRAQKARKLPRGYLPAEIADEALKAGVVNAQEVALLKEALKARIEAIQVDEFTPEQYFARVEGDALVVGEASLKRAVNQ